MSTVTTCLTTLGAKYGLSELSIIGADGKKINPVQDVIEAQAEMLEEALRDLSMSNEARAELFENITKAMGDTYKQGVLDKAQMKTTEATMAVSILDKARVMGGDDFNLSHLKKAATELLWGEGGSVMFAKIGRKSDYAAGFYSRLLKKDSLALFKKAAHNKDINAELARIIHDMSDGFTADELTLKHYTPQQAKDTYEALRFSYDRMFFDKKQVGINIGKQPNYVGRVRYGTAEMAAMGPDNFVVFAMENIDADTSFSKNLALSKADQEKFFYQMYDEMTLGKSAYVTVEDTTFSPFIRSRMKERQLHWKKGSSFKVFKELSPISDVNTMVSQEIDEASSIVSNYRFFGPNPKESVSNVVELITHLTKAQGIKPKISALSKIKIPGLPTKTPHELIPVQIREFAAEMDKATLALTEKPSNQIGAFGYGMQSLNNLQVASKLGATSLFTALPTDFETTQMTVLQDRGVREAMKAAGVQARRTLQLLAKSDNELLELQRAMMVNVDTTNMTWQDKLGPEFALGISGEGMAQAVTRGTSKYAGMATKFSFLDHQFKAAHLNGAAESLHTMGMMISPEYADNKFVQAAMGDLNLTKSEEQIFRQLTLGIEGVAGGSRMLKIESIFDLPLETFGTNANVARGRRTALIDKISGFANSRAGQSSPKPNLRTSFKKGNKVTNMDMAMKAMFLFKNTIWHITDITARQVSRVYDVGGAASLTGGAAYIGAHALAVYAVTETIASAIVDQKSKTLGLLEGDVESFALDFGSKMSTVPIYTDVIVRAIQQRNRWGQSALVDSLTGPNASMIRDMENIFKSRNKGEAAMKFGANHLLPASNFMVKSASQHVFDYDIRKMRAQKRKDEFRVPDF